MEQCFYSSVQYRLTQKGSLRALCSQLYTLLTRFILSFFHLVCFYSKIYIIIFFSVTSEKKYFVSVINIFANTFGYLIIKQLIRSNPDENPAEMCCSYLLLLCCHIQQQ